MNLYELNQAGYGSLPTLTEVELASQYKKINNFLNKYPSSYYMLLNNESRYYTVFTYQSEQNQSKMISEIISIAKELGEIKAIEVNEDHLEFWIMSDKICRMYVLLDYQKGVVEV